MQVFERFEWCAVRWLQVTVRDAPEGLAVRGLGANLTNYPVEARGRFASSEPFLDKLWATGAYTLRQCMHDAWEDCPSREQRQWLGDVTVENLVGWAAFGPSVAPLTAKYLAQVAESQRPDGLTQMFAPGDHKTDGLLIPDWTLQWVLTAADHWRYTGDAETIHTIFPSIIKALAWFERLIDPSGLVADMPYWHFMDWAGVGRHGEAAALNAQLAGAFLAAAEMAEVVGWPAEAQRCRARAHSLARALEARHWEERRGAYVDVVDPATGAQEPRTSQHGNAAIALWGEPSAARVARALDRITDSARLTFTPGPPVAPHGTPLDEEHGVVLANTFYSHFVYEALGKHGRFAQALRQMRERFGPMLDRGATTLWESFEPTASPLPRLLRLPHLPTQPAAVGRQSGRRRMGIGGGRAGPRWSGVRRGCGPHHARRHRGLPGSHGDRLPRQGQWRRSADPAGSGAGPDPVRIAVTVWRGVGSRLHSALG